MITEPEIEGYVKTLLRHFPDRLNEWEDGFLRDIQIRYIDKRETWRLSTYATDLLVDLRFWARTGGWMPKRRYLLYEGLITAEDAERIGPLDGVLLQDGKADAGRSRHRAFREVGCGIVGEAAA